MSTPLDIHYMRRAMTLAQRGEGQVNPNPLVGAVVVDNRKQGDDGIIAEGWHHRYGDLHAERDAFRNADASGADCRGMTMYVTLEPCCHHGHQPPCTEAIVERGIKRVVVGLTDPNPLVAGKGLALLKDAGIEVEMIGSTGEGRELERQLRYQNRVFLHYMTSWRPWVTMKYAMTLDGKICTSSGDSRWVSGEEARRRVHEMRHEYMSIVCGIGTVLADDPMLNTRLEGKNDARNPIRIVADRRLRLPLDCRLAATAREIPTIVAHSEGVDQGKRDALQALGIRTWECNSLRALLERMHAERIDGMLLEGGGTLNEAFLREGLVDEVFAFIAPKIVGGSKAKTPVEGEGLLRMADAVQLRDVKTERLGEDILVRALCSQV
jgi:diaminohydroxyphosphoribosylaminopyrimidine deaminase / 5-amino-6-(5-phosphoribosylamino)uracil reductase